MSESIWLQSTVLLTSQLWFWSLAVPSALSEIICMLTLELVLGLLYRSV